jgi:hypothetical protein
VYPPERLLTGYLLVVTPVLAFDDAFSEVSLPSIGLSA